MSTPRGAGHLRRPRVREPGGEQGRIYRLAINGHIRPSDMCRYMFGLREIRVSIEALPPEAAKAPPAQIQIVAIDHGQFLSEDDVRGLHGLQPFKLVRQVSNFSIEHDPTPPTPAEAPADEEFVPRNEKERQLLAELEALSPEELQERARQAGYYDVAGN